MKRYCEPVLSSETEKSSRVSASASMMRVSDPFVVDQAAKQLSGEASNGKNGLDIAAEPLDDPRDIDAAAARIAPRRRTAQLEHRHNAIDRGR